jgi:hypothetical protein
LKEFGLRLSTSGLTTLTVSLLLLACAKSGISQDLPVASSGGSALVQDFSSTVDFPYQRPTDEFDQASIIANPNDATRFALRYYPRAYDPRLVVTVNGVLVTSGYSLSSNQLIFQPQPPPLAHITVTYDPENPNDVMTTHRLLIPGSMNLLSLQVLMNGIPVRLTDLRLSLNEQGDYVFDPSLLLFDYDDPYQIYSHQGLHVQVLGQLLEPAGD